MARVVAARASASSGPRVAADPALRSMPPESPLEMPAQDLRRAARYAPRSSARFRGRRAIVLGGAGALASLNAAIMLQLMGRDGLSWLEGVTVSLSAALCAWIAFGCISAFAGFGLAWRAAGHRQRTGFPVLSTRTAILVPTYNESPARVLAAAEAMYDDLRHRGVAGFYDLFILSDTRDARVARAEATGVLRVRLRLGADAGVYYRRRARNTDRKVGNIADWVRRFGGAYESMLVLDADSLMSADTILRMTAAMEHDPALGLLQSAPILINAETPFARLHQFASALYGPLSALGQDWWSGPDGNYWGHNAMIRVRAFAESAGLPDLTGPPPFGGHIQSHDFVEAALLRRAGWTVRMWPALPGSYEETPPTLLDMACRDRRWCQGNLQHIRLLGTAGLHWVSRLHLLRGVLSYLTAPMWLLLLVCGAAVWPTLEASPDAPSKLTALFAMTTGLLLAPKVLALLLALRHPRTRADFGGAGRLIAGVLAESVVSMLIAPVTMIMQTTAVIDVLLGRDSGWGAQARDEADISPRLAWRAHRIHVALGVLGAVATAFLSTNLLIWTSPVFVGLSLSSLLSIHTARAGAGRALRRGGLFQTPCERRPSRVLARAAALREAYENETAGRWEIELLMRGPAALYSLTAPDRHRPTALAA